MSEPVWANLLNAERAGALLGVTPMRVRQMVTEGVLPRSMELGNRLGVWHYADVTAVKAARIGLPASRPLGLLDAPERPLAVHHDAVLNVPCRGDAVWPVHVRVWTGPTPQGRRVVVLLGQMPDGPSTLGRLSEIMPVVVEQVTGLSVLDLGPELHTVWLTYRPGDDIAPHSVDHLIWTGARTNTAEVGRFERVRLLSRRWAGRTEPNLETPPLRRPASLAEVERLVGRPVAGYPAQAYTADTIQQWQAAGSRDTIEVTHDPIAFRQLLDAAHRLAAQPGMNARAELAERAVWLLADEARQRLAFLLRGHWDDGTAPTFPTSEPTTPWPSTWAARLVPPTPTEEDQALLDAHPTPFVISSDPAEHSELRVLLGQLRDWSTALDPYTEHPEEPLCAAVATAERVLADYLHKLDPDGFARTDYPDATPRLYEVVSSGRWDRAYLNSVHWEDPGDTPVRRRLDEQLHGLVRGEGRGTEPIRYGRDAGGRLVAHYRGEEHRPRSELMAIEWPLRPPVEPVPAGTRIVADGESGDRPAYLVEPDGRINPLPANPRALHAPWNFGYSGGGPGALASAIARMFAETDGIDSDQMPRRWIDDQVDHADQQELNIDVDQLRRRYPA